jgi:hypothetical protein
MAYRKVDSCLWGSSTFRSMSEDARSLYQYLLTSPHNNALCCYRLGPGTAADDLQWEASRAEKAFMELVKTCRPDGTPMLHWDKATGLVAVHGQLEKEKIVNPNSATACLKVLESLPSTSPVFSEPLRACEQLAKPFLKRLVKRLRERIPEQQEQEQEQEQETGDIPPEELHTPPPVVGAPEPLELSGTRQPPKAVVKIPCKDGLHQVTEKDLRLYRELYGNIDVLQLLKRMAGHWESKPLNQRKTLRGIKTSINRWLAEDNDKAAPRARASPGPARPEADRRRSLG